MRISFIVARVNGQPHVLSGGRLVPVDSGDPVVAFKKIVGEGSGLENAEAVEVWTSDSGVTKRAKLKAAKSAQAPVEPAPVATPEPAAPAQEQPAEAPAAPLADPFDPAAPADPEAVEEEAEKPVKKRGKK